MHIHRGSQRCAHNEQSRYTPLMGKCFRPMIWPTLLLVLIGTTTVPRVALAAPSDEPVSGAATPASAAVAQRAAEVARVVKGIVNFTQWPNKSNIVRLCVVQPARYADALTQAPLGLGIGKGARTIQPIQYALDDPHLAADCDAIYIEISEGNVAIGASASDVSNSVNAVETMLRRVTGKPILTITASEEGCDIGSLFCLTSAPASVSFAANLDGIARSTLLVNPKVLLLARPAGGAK